MTPAGPPSQAGTGGQARPPLARTAGAPAKRANFGAEWAGSTHTLSVLHQSRPFSEGDAWLSIGKANGDVWAALVHGTDVFLSLASGCHRQHSFSWVAAAPLAPVCDVTARVTPICCLGRIMPGTTVEWASSEIAPRGPARPLDTTLDAPPGAPRQLDKR